MREYKKYEFCKAKRCSELKPTLENASSCYKNDSHCIWTAKEFHKWLQENNFIIQKGEIKMKKVFLGGTCNGSNWRNTLIPQLKINYFNPVVDHWDEEAQKKEIYEREHCDYCLYTITPRMEGGYSIAEVIDDSNKRPDKTIFILLETDGALSFGGHQWKAMQKIASLVKKNGAKVFDNLKSAAIYMNE